MTLSRRDIRAGSFFRRRRGHPARFSRGYRGRVSEAPVTCDHCGAVAPGAEPPLTWSVAVERGRALRFCDRCTRENLRAMEGKLDQEYW